MSWRPLSGQKKQSLALDSCESLCTRNLDWVVGDHSAATFAPLWDRIKGWACYFWVTDGYPVYPQFIPEGDQIVSKPYMTRVEGENTR